MLSLYKFLRDPFIFQFPSTPLYNSLHLSVTVAKIWLPTHQNSSPRYGYQITATHQHSLLTNPDPNTPTLIPYWNLYNAEKIMPSNFNKFWKSWWMWLIGTRGCCVMCGAQSLLNVENLVPWDDDSMESELVNNEKCRGIYVQWVS